ncbi:MAG TPA: YbjN domain-containing protein [Pyrinomonadaceae bacterium]|jgi:hypothetical protein|nr:YbjN domain-containing protein [Pyrinomonadaceae bacterium]
MAETDRARKNGLKALKNVKKVLKTTGWEPEETEKEGVLRVDFSGDNIPIVDALADVRIDYERFLYYLNFRERAPVKQRPETMEFVTRVNYDMVIGNFELNLDNGFVRFKSSVDFTGAELAPALIRDAIKSAMDAVEQYADAIVEVMHGRKKARKALHDAES